MLVTGDLAADNVTRDQPAKLAAMEAVPRTMSGAPLVIGGWLDQKSKTVRYGIKIPYMLSFLAFHDPNAKVRGLDSFPPGSTPDVNMVHPFFDLMVFGFFIMLVPVVWFWLARWRKKEIAGNRPLLLLIVFSSPFGLLSQEFGWFVTEFGRQPWIARQIMKVVAGVTPNQVQWVLILFVLVYLALTAGLLKLFLTSAQVRSGLSRRKEDHYG